MQLKNKNHMSSMFVVSSFYTNNFFVTQKRKTKLQVVTNQLICQENAEKNKYAKRFLR